MAENVTGEAKSQSFLSAADGDGAMMAFAGDRSAGEEAVKVGVVANRANSGEAEEEAIGRPPMDDEGSDKSISMILIELKRNQRQRKPIVKKKAPATISLKRKVASTMQKEM